MSKSAKYWKKAAALTWEQRWERIARVLSSRHFWWTLLGVSGALVVWFYLFHQAIKHIDTSLAMHSTFCTSDAERNQRILAIVLLIPLFLVGLLGVIGEWMAFVDNRRHGRKTNFKPLIYFSVLLQVTALFILIAMQC